MQILEDKIADYLSSCRELSHLIDSDGWLETDSLEFEIVRNSEREVTVALRFVEVVTKAYGGPVERVDRQGYLILVLDAYGDIVGVRPG